MGDWWADFPGREVELELPSVGRSGRTEGIKQRKRRKDTGRAALSVTEQHWAENAEYCAALFGFLRWIFQLRGDLLLRVMPAHMKKGSPLLAFLDPTGGVAAPLPPLSHPLFHLSVPSSVLIPFPVHMHSPFLFCPVCIRIAFFHI